MSPEVFYPNGTTDQSPRIDIRELARDLWPGSTTPRLMWSIWPAAKPHQKHVAHSGFTRIGSWETLCRWVEDEHHGPVYAKSRGPQWAPVANKDGHRCIESTTAVYSVTLDCDGDGDWDQIIAYLESVGAAYLAYRSAGHTPDLPKWRLVLPLAKPWITQSDPTAANKVWHGIYECARNVFSSLAGFDKTGYDSGTKCIANVFYLGHRRTEETPVREVRWRDGLAVDGEVLLAAAASTAAGTVGDTETAPTQRTSIGTIMATGNGLHVKKYLPPDTVITLTSSGTEKGTVAFEDITTGSHCLCPEHGGSGGGSAWVTVSQFGPAIHCCRCNGGTTWFPDVVSLPPGFVVPPHQETTEEDIEALLADLDNEATKTKKTKPIRKPKLTPEEEAEEKLWAERLKMLTPEEMDKHKRVLAERKKRLQQKRAERLRAEDAGRAVEGSKKWMPIVGEHPKKHGMVAAPCGFKQVLRGPRQGRLHHRDCGKGTCLQCMTKRVALKLGAIEYMPLWGEGEDAPLRGAPMGHRDLWMWETTKRRTRSLKDAFGRSAGLSATGASTSLAESPALSAGPLTTPATDPEDQGTDFDHVDGYIMFGHADGKTITFIATTSMPRSRVWHPKAKKIAAGGLSAVLEDLIGKCIVPEVIPVEIEGVEMIGNPTELRVQARSIISGHTLTLDPETLWKRASKSGWTVAHHHGAKPEDVARRWKEAGVLKAMQAAHQVGDGKFVPGFAQTVTIDDPALVDAVLDLASADAQKVMAAEAKLARHKARKTKAEKVVSPLGSPPSMEELIQMVAA